MAWPIDIVVSFISGEVSVTELWFVPRWKINLQCWHWTENWMRPCPLYHTGFTEGWINWDDEDTNNINKYSGTLPEGNYGRNTKMYFCCRSDGFSTNAIALPTASPFVLMKFGYQCQHVHGMKVTEEFFRWDCEDSNTQNRRGGAIPAGHVKKLGEIKIFYCYYYPNWTIKSLQSNLQW